MTAVGSNIKRIRKSKGLTQEALGQLSNTSRSTIIRIETGGEYDPPTIGKIAFALGVNIDDLTTTTPTFIDRVASEVLKELAQESDLSKILFDKVKELTELLKKTEAERVEWSLKHAELYKELHELKSRAINSK